MHLAILWRFLRFGAFAFGGPVAQIGMVKRELVDRERWIEPERFGRVLGVYQALPGPEAHELCVHFGMVRGGRLGGLLAGLGFMGPGLVLMLIFSALYASSAGPLAGTSGLTNPWLLAASAGAAPAAVLLVVRGGIRIGAGALRSGFLIAGALAAATVDVVGSPFWIGLAAAALLGEAAVARTWTRVAIAIGLALLVLATVVFVPDPKNTLLVEAIPAAANQGYLLLVGGPSLPALFWIGLQGGLLTFGGAYTAIPFVRGLAVGGPNGFMTDAVFLDGLAIGSLLPAPLVIFSTFVGYIGGGLPGALATTAGMFLPAFAFTLVGFNLIERVVEAPRVHALLDGITAGVVGIVAVTVVRLADAAFVDARAALAAIPAAVVLFAWRSPWSAPVAIAAGVAVGIVLR